MNNIELDTLRLKIDDIDFQLSNLLKERQSLASKIMIAKKGNSPFDPEREEKVHEIQEELASSISEAHVNALPGSIHQTFRTEIKSRRNVAIAVRLDLKEFCEGRFAMDLQKRESAKNHNRSLENLREDQEVSSITEKASTEDGQYTAGKSKNSSKEEKAERQREYLAFTSQEQGLRNMNSHLESTEDGIDLSDLQRRQSEHLTKSDRERTFEREGGGSFGVSLFDLVQLNIEGTIGGRRLSRDVTEDRSIDSSEQARRAQHKDINQDTTQLDAHSVEKEQEEIRDKATLLRKSDISDQKRWEAKFGKKREQRTSGKEGSHQSQEKQQILDKDEERGIVSTFHQHELRSRTLSKAQDYHIERSDESVCIKTNAFDIPPGYLVMIKVESIGTTTIKEMRAGAEIEVEYSREIQFNSLSPFLRPLANRISNPANRRFFQTRYVIETKAESVSPTVKCLSLAMQAGVKDYDPNLIRLNQLYYRLSFLFRKSPKIWDSYINDYAQFDKKYTEMAGVLQLVAPAREYLEKMFEVCLHIGPIAETEEFEKLYLEFNDPDNRNLSYISQQGSGLIFQKSMLKETDTKGFVIGGCSLTLEDSYKNFLVVGGTGSGKTAQVAIPNLLEFDGVSLLVNDVDGQIYKETHEAMKKKGYDVKVLNLANPSRTETFNPFDSLDVDSFDGTKQVVECLLRATGHDDKSKPQDHFWIDGAKMILELSLFHLINYSKQENGDSVTLKDLYHFVNGLTPTKIDELKMSPFPIVSELARSLGSSENALRDRIAHATSALAYIASDCVQAVSSSSSISFDEIGRKKTVVFVNVGSTQLKNYRFILSLFYTRFFSFCCQSSKNRSLPIFLMMDEFGHIPIPDFEVIITTLRKHRVGICAMVQSISQLKNLYGDEGAKTMLQGGFVSKLFFGLDSSELDIAQRLVASHGKIMRYKRTLDLASGSMTLHQEEVEKVDIEALMAPGKGRATFVHAGLAPCQVMMTPYYENPKFRNLKRSVVEKSSFKAFGSKEEAIEELLIELTKRCPKLQTGLIKMNLKEGNIKKLEATLSKKGISLEDELIMDLMRQSIQDRSNLFVHPRFLILDERTQISIKNSYEQASKEDTYDSSAFLDFFEILLENNFTLEEIVNLEKQYAVLFPKYFKEVYMKMPFLIVDLHRSGEMIADHNIHLLLCTEFREYEGRSLIDLVKASISLVYSVKDILDKIHHQFVSTLISEYELDSEQFQITLNKYHEIYKDRKTKQFLHQENEWNLEEIDLNEGLLRIVISNKDERKTLKYQKR